MKFFCLTTGVLAVALSVCPMANSAIIIGHRGSPFEAPENTVASAVLAWKQGADMVELDIYLTRDQKIVVIHDASTKRTTGVEGNVEEMTLEELRQLDAGKFKNPKYTGEKLPTLEEMIATIPDGKGLVIEIKGGPGIVPYLKQVLENSGKPMDQFQIISFKYESIKAAKAAIPQCKVFWLAAYDQKKSNIDDLISRSHEAKLDGLDLHYSWPIDDAFVKRLKSENLMLYTWTVDDAKIARSEVSAGVDGITTDRPGWLREKLKN